MTDRRPDGAAPGGAAEQFTVTASDGTRLTAWRTARPVAGRGAGALPVVLSPGLGAPPSSFPQLWDGSRQVVTWAHRGALGTDRPADEDAVTVADHADDLFAVMDACDLTSALVVGWSIGVNVAAHAAVSRPDRVRGLLGVAGVPGGTFATMGAPLGVPAPLRHPLAASTVRAAALAGPVLTATSEPLLGHAWSPYLARTGFILPVADRRLVKAMLADFAVNDWGWYLHLARAASRHEPIDPVRLELPSTLVGGRFDLLTDWRAVRRVAAALPDGRFRKVGLAGHFVPVEQPHVITEELDLLAARVR